MHYRSSRTAGALGRPRAPRKRRMQDRPRHGPQHERAPPRRRRALRGGAPAPPATRGLRPPRRRPPRRGPSARLAPNGQPLERAETPESRGEAHQLDDEHRARPRPRPRRPAPGPASATTLVAKASRRHHRAAAGAVERQEHDAEEVLQHARSATAAPRSASAGAAGDVARAVDPRRSATARPPPAPGRRARRPGGAPRPPGSSARGSAAPPAASARARDRRPRSA